MWTFCTSKLCIIFGAVGTPLFAMKSASNKWTPNRCQFKPQWIFQSQISFQILCFQHIKQHIWTFCTSKLWFTFGAVGTPLFAVKSASNKWTPNRCQFKPQWIFQPQFLSKFYVFNLKCQQKYSFTKSQWIIVLPCKIYGLLNWRFHRHILMKLNSSGLQWNRHPISGRPAVVNLSPSGFSNPNFFPSFMLFYIKCQCCDHFKTRGKKVRNMFLDHLQLWIGMISRIFVNSTQSFIAAPSTK